ncbi:hypothetical protein [Pseudoalteromonas prydzensis]|uniref:hypothetical protein n=1 Tax=Pseudoalteromonas prydzensis TaxID=182141 RepID=UPI003FD595BC
MSKVEKTINTIKGYFLSNYVITVGLSGKDSACVAHCAVEALKAAKQEQPDCRGILYLVTTNTTIDNFEVHKFVLKLHAAARDYAKEYDLPIITKEIKPQLMNRMWTQTVGRGKLLRTMQTASRGRDCTQDWKIEPMKQFIKELEKTYQTDKILSMSGTRDSESAIRAINIASRGESIDLIVKTDLGNALAPIKNWVLNDVWGLIGQIEDDAIESFIDIHAAELRKHYSAGNGGTCDIFSGNNKANDKACTARFGCVISLVKDDKSLEGQVKTQPDTYGYMEPFIHLRRFMIDTLFDLERSRSLTGREVLNQEWVKVGYNQYSLDYRKELLRYILTIDANEREVALANGIEPRFEMIGYDGLLAIQYMWAREGNELVPAEAIKIWHDVHTFGKRYAIPDTSPVEFANRSLNFGSLNFIAGSERHEYRYVNFKELAEDFPTDFHGLAACYAEQKYFKCHRVLLDGKMQYVTPFRETKRNTIDPQLAEQYINETYFDLQAEGIFDKANEVCPTFIIKDILYNEVLTIRKGGMNRLHQDLKRAQIYNSITMTKAWGSSSLVDSILLAKSITEAEYLERIAADNVVQDDFQMALGF